MKDISNFTQKTRDLLNYPVCLLRGRNVEDKQSSSNWLGADNNRVAAEFEFEGVKL
jgi:hypothetical protein